jgi:hypothetical protein
VFRRVTFAESGAKFGTTFSSAPISLGPMAIAPRLSGIGHQAASEQMLDMRDP